MEFRILTLEVDGTLRNPFVVATVVTWSTMLSGATWLLVRWVLGSAEPSGASPRLRRVLAVPALALLFLATPVAQHVLGNLIYQLDYMRRSETLASVGFWGGPPIAPSWIAAVLFGALCVWRRKRKVAIPSVA